MTKVGITGHQELAGSILPLVRDQLEIELSAHQGLVGITSLAEGADQLFAEVVLQLGGSLDVVVPSTGYDGSFRDEKSRHNYEALLTRARRVSVLPFPEPTEEAFLVAGQEVVKRSDIVLAVWDGEPAEGTGGTGDVVEYARAIGKPVTVLWPAS